ncbi:MAG TPA: hypothetical protein PLD01_16080 [Mycobacterium sp.]|nr:hypothetical protein [Mycobacterium sp.]
MSTMGITDNPREIANWIFDALDNAIHLNPGSDTVGDVPTVTAGGGLVFSIGPDPREDGILWSIDADTFGDGSQFDPIRFGGWATGDQATADKELAEILSLMRGTQQ